jgi:hypothetical protein
MSVRQESYFIGNGDVFIAPVSNGVLTGAYLRLGNVPSLSLTTSVTKVQHKESYSGLGLNDLVIETGRSAMIDATLESFDPDILAAALYGTKTVVSAGTVTGETAKAYKGGYTFLASSNVSSVVVKKGVATLVLNTDYELDAKSGSLYFLPAGVTVVDGDDILIDYTKSASNKVSGLSLPNKNVSLIFKGLDQASETGLLPVTTVRAYKVRLEPASTIQLINTSTSVNSYSLKGEILRDINGRFFDIERP